MFVLNIKTRSNAIPYTEVYCFGGFFSVYQNFLYFSFLRKFGRRVRSLSCYSVEISYFIIILNKDVSFFFFL